MNLTWLGLSVFVLHFDIVPAYHPVIVAMDITPEIVDDNVEGLKLMKCHLIDDATFHDGNQSITLENDMVKSDVRGTLKTNNIQDNVNNDITDDIAVDSLKAIDKDYLNGKADTVATLVPGLGTMTSLVMLEGHI